jgi:preprotein translocase SecE subunit
VQESLVTSQAGAAREGRGRFRFITETIGELKKVVWLTRREAAYLTVLVLIVSIIAGIFLGLLDFGFSGLVDKVFLGR